MRAEQNREAEDHQQQLEDIHRTAVANAERTRKLTDAEITDLQNTIRKLEADLEKVFVIPYPIFCRFLTADRQTKTMYEISRLHMMNIQRVRQNKQHGCNELKRR